MEADKISFEELMRMDHLNRAHLVNSITGFKSANLIGTQSKDGADNLAVFSSVTHFGSNPPIVGFVLRPTTVARNTYENIKSTGYYTINHINKDIIAQAHHTSAKYDEGISEFEASGLTACFLDHFMAPFVKESVIRLGVEYREEIPIQINGTILILGEIKTIYIPKKLIAVDGFVDLNKAQTVTVSGLDAYHQPQKLERFEYARPYQMVKKIKTER